jgi:enoyl-CoA hydratase/carnithine racemase
MTATTAPVDSEPVLLRHQEGGVATLTLNRPGQFNALSDAVLAELQSALDGLAVDPSVRVVVLAGAGKAFCAGHDLKEMRTRPSLEAQRDLFGRCARVMSTLTAIPQPVIARVHGVATAAGCQLVASCDLAVAAEEARFAVSGINVGLFCSTPSVPLGRAMSRKQAMEMLLTGDFIDAAEARARGLVNRVVPLAALDAEVRKLTLAVCAKSSVAVSMGKQLFYRQLELGVEAAYELAGETMARNMMTQDAAEGIDAFLARRKPVWKGA